MLGLFKGIQFFLSEVFKFWMITIFSLDYRLYRYHFCFVAIHQSNPISLKVSDNPRVQFLAVSLIHSCLCLVWYSKPKLAWGHNFLMEMFAITEKPAVFLLKNSNFWRASTQVDIKCSNFLQVIFDVVLFDLV